jgi:hypothetical protein
MVNLLTRDALHIVMELIANPSDEPGRKPRIRVPGLELPLRRMVAPHRTTRAPAVNGRPNREARLKVFNGASTTTGSPSDPDTKIRIVLALASDISDPAGRPRTRGGAT